MADNHDTEQFLRHMLPRISCRFFGDQRGHIWLVAEFDKLDTTLESASYIDLLTVEDELHGLQEAARGIPAQPSESAPVEPPAEPVEEHDVLKQIAEEKITPEQIQHLESLAAQYRLNPMEFAELLKGYGADQIVELKDANYRAVISDIHRTGAITSGRKKAPRR